MMRRGDLQISMFSQETSAYSFLRTMNRNTGIPQYETRDPFYGTGPKRAAVKVVIEAAKKKSKK
jgi:hypothetical protein